MAMMRPEESRGSPGTGEMCDRELSGVYSGPNQDPLEKEQMLLNTDHPTVLNLQVTILWGGHMTLSWGSHIRYLV